MEKLRNKKILIVTALVVAVLGLAIGFAAFSTTLNISSQAIVSPDANTFKVVFSNKSDSVDANEVTPTVTPDTINASNGKIDNTTNPTLTNLKADFTEPGQKAVYNLYVYNAGEYIAYLNSVTLKGNKSCTPGSGATVSLVGKACEDIKVTVKVGNDSYNQTTTGITGKSIGIGKSTPVEITIEYIENGARADGPFSVEFNDVSLYYGSTAGEDEEYNGESGTLYTGVIYRNSNENLFIDNYINTANRWCVVVPGVANSCVENDYLDMAFASKTECETFLEESANSGQLDETMQYLVDNAVCEQGTLSYETNVANISQNYYLKHEIVNNKVTASYACITYTENGVRKDACVRGGVEDPLVYASNQAILKGIEPYFNTLYYNSSYNNYKGCCRFDDSISHCDSDSLRLYANSVGHVSAYDGSLDCYVYSDGCSFCY